MKKHLRHALSTVLALLGVSSLHSASNYETPYTFTTIAGSSSGTGSTDGTGETARFRRPLDVTVDGRRNIYVADTDNHTIRRITGAGVVTTWAGQAGSAGYDDGAAGQARFNAPADWRWIKRGTCMFRMRVIGSAKSPPPRA